MAFNRNEVSELLVKCHRRCCICHRFCGIKIETDHIDPKSNRGADDISNAIPVCFECHAEIHCYNDEHPRGRKFTKEELTKHKEQWLEVCKKYPEILVDPAKSFDVGPLSSLLDELDFNATACGNSSKFPLLKDRQFEYAIQAGALALLDGELKTSIYHAYAAISKVNECVRAEINQDVKMRASGYATINAREALKDATDKIRDAYDNLLAFLKVEE
ncbi:MAG: HNH endonuclease [Planctomycetota bacterium]